MSDEKGISYVDESWSPIAMRCDRVSPGCLNCWHLKMVARMRANHKLQARRRQAYSGCGPVLLEDVLDKPLRWKRPRRVAVQFMGDLFHKSVPFTFAERAYDTMMLAQKHTFLVLTKRPERALEFYEYLNPELIRNVWLGVSVENQATGDERIPLLLQCPAAVRWVSVEPLLGPVDLGLLGTAPKDWGYGYRPIYELLHWVVVGGESGPGARPCNVEWIRSIVGQCKAASVPVYVKQDSGPKSGLQGRIPDDLWIQQFPGGAS